MLESTSGSTVTQFKTELLPLADPGNGIYAAILDRVIGLWAYIQECKTTTFDPSRRQCDFCALHSVSWVFLNSNRKSKGMLLFFFVCPVLRKWNSYVILLRMLTYIKQSGAGQGRAGDDVAAAARIQSLTLRYSHLHRSLNHLYRWCYRVTAEIIEENTNLPES